MGSGVSKAKAEASAPGKQSDEPPNQAYYPYPNPLPPVPAPFQPVLKPISNSTSKSGPSPPPTILLMGETGCGKSTFINTLWNVWKHAERGTSPVKNGPIYCLIPTRHLDATEKYMSFERDTQRTGESMTDRCSLYEFRYKKRLYHIIDTPGLSDTRSAQQDDENINSIIGMAESVGYLSAIAVIINGRSARNTVNVANAMARTIGVLPKALVENVLVVFTNCTQVTRNFDPTNIPFKVMETYHIDNSLFSSDRKRWDPKQKKALEKDWKTSAATVGKLLDKMAQVQPVPTSAFAAMKSQRNRIRAELNALQLEVNKLQILQDSMEAANSAKDLVSQDKEKYSAFTQQKQIEYEELVDADYHSTICSTCNTVCHDRCGLEFTPDKNSNVFCQCACMSGHNTCQVCKERCGPSSHYHAKKRVKKLVKSVEHVLIEMKAQFEESEKKEKDLTSKICNFENDLAQVKALQKGKMEEIKKLCLELKEICPDFNLVHELYAVVTALKFNARKLTSMQARVDAEQIIKNIEGIIDGISVSLPQPQPGPSHTLPQQFVARPTDLGTGLQTPVPSAGPQSPPDTSRVLSQPSSTGPPVAQYPLQLFAAPPLDSGSTPLSSPGPPPAYFAPHPYSLSQFLAAPNDSSHPSLQSSPAVPVPYCMPHPSQLYPFMMQYPFQMYAGMPSMAPDQLQAPAQLPAVQPPPRMP